jgi:two-component system, NarL family, nitrate/nitrite response regulator NarL
MSDSRAPIRVLLVDDHRTVLRGLEWLINAERNDMVVCGSATNVAEAKRLSTEQRPDVVILDLDLGDDDGLHAIPEFSRHTAVLVLTGLRDVSVHHAAVAAGARGVVAKECEPEHILKAIRKVHAGEIWLDRVGMQKVFSSLVGGKSAPTAPPEHPAVASMTPREREIIRVLSANAGAPAKQVAELLKISEHTLRNHLTSIYDKVGVSSRLALYEFAHKQRLT